MIKDFLVKSLKNVFEIHCLKVDDLQTNQSVVGSVSGGKRKVRGSTHTIHNTIINADNRLYQNVDKNSNYPFKAGDKMAFVCYEGKNGIWRINSLINFTNNSSKILQYILLRLLFLLPFGWLVGLMLAGVVGLIVIFLTSALPWLTNTLIFCIALVYIVFSFWLPCYVYKMYINLKHALQVLESLKNMKNEEEIKKCLTSYNGKSLISDNFFSDSK